MSCEVAALQFQAHANYGTWSIDFYVQYIKVKGSILRNIQITCIWDNYVVVSEEGF